MTTQPSSDELRHIYETSSVIAVVGASANETKTAHVIPSYLRDQGYSIVPVNPRQAMIMGELSYPSLVDISGPVDVVEVFRPAEEAPEIARQAVAIGARVLWLQVGIVSDEAAKIAEDAGLVFVSDLCMGMMHAVLELGPGPEFPD